ncbi:tetratricopeptide repeat protein [Streptomyces sp. N2-109]|uniref:Tetratricopeptide repeat protein n=1 Tax=Streptomyces gossypii TaxID=2883101 RepID=A0ABT2JT07_9ACTN|nr:tetratricopeptide repeat protein [Streptomyces gossypii]MCT2591007.1 tetratricopeptide repeat protein [Streptomyces gossypii]
MQARDVHGGIHFHPAPLDLPPVPRQLPPPPGAFVGRTEDLHALGDLRDISPSAAPQLVVVTGPAGVGKSTLASWWLRQGAETFPDGQLYVDLRGNAPSDALPPSSVLERFLRALGSGSVPADFAEQVALWRTVTARRRLALLLDDAFTAAQVRPLLPSGPGSVTVVTSRRHLAGLVSDGAVLHPVRVLAAGDAVELLARGGGRSRVEQDPQAARRVAAQCAHLPLAVCLAAAQLAARPRRPVAALAEALSATGPLEALQVDGDAAVRTALDQSYDLLPKGAAYAYRCIGLLPARSVDSGMLAAVCALPAQSADQLLDTLIQTSLLEDAGDDRYGFHDLVRQHARHRGAREDRQTVLRRFVDWCLAGATAAEAILSPSHRNLARTYEHRPETPVSFAGDAEALAWLDGHRDTLMAAVRHSSDSGWHASCWQLVDAMWPLFLRLRPAELWIEAHALGLEAARRTSDRDGENRMLTSGGNGLRNAGRHREAAEWYRQALRCATEDGDLRQQAQARNGLGHAQLQSGELSSAREHFAQALRLRQSIGYERGVALSRLSLGETALAAGELSTAIGQLEQAHSTLITQQDAYDGARALALLGQAQVRDGAYRTGSAQLREALEQFEASGSAHWQARTCEMLGQAAERAGDPETAQEYYGRALEILRSISPADAERLVDRMRGL